MTISQTAAAAVEQHIRSWASAVRQMLLQQIQQCYADEVRAFDAVQQLQFNKQAYLQHWQHCMEFCTNHSAFELRDLQVQASEELAVGTALLYCAGTNDKGELQGCWMRLTQAWQLQGNQWRIIHDHFSVPFDMVSGNVLFNLQPA